MERGEYEQRAQDGNYSGIYDGWEADRTTRDCKMWHTGKERTACVADEEGAMAEVEVEELKRGRNR